MARGAFSVARQAFNDRHPGGLPLSDRTAHLLLAVCKNPCSFGDYPIPTYQQTHAAIEWIPAIIRRQLLETPTVPPARFRVADSALREMQLTANLREATTACEADEGAELACVDGVVHECHSYIK